MRIDRFRICGMCAFFVADDRYEGHCTRKKELTRVSAIYVHEIPLRVRWNHDARNCEDFKGGPI